MWPRNWSDCAILPSLNDIFRQAPCNLTPNGASMTGKASSLSVFCLPIGPQLFERDDTWAGLPRVAGGTMTGDITMANGTVKWFNATKGFGFIAPAGGSKDVFVHVTALERAGIRSLPDGQAVTYDVEQDRNGRESAVNLALA
jgi:CspA family cold shock protein